MTAYLPTKPTSVSLGTMLLFLALCSSVQSQDTLAPKWPTKKVQLDSIQWTIPEFCSIEKVTTEDLCTWPIAATFAPDGSIVVAESVWNIQAKETVQQQLLSRPHRIIRLRDTDNDGKFDQRQVVADKLSFPEGVLCIGRDIYVTAPPEIWKLTDVDGDGVCEKREVWFDGTTLTGCANDLHGPWLGPDGWIYWTKAAFSEQSHQILSGKDWKSKASHLYRRHPSGGPIDPVMTGGMDNLVDIAWLPNGDRFFCATFLHHPRHGFRDGIGAATYGALFGKPHGVLDGHPRTGPLMNPTAELGPAAPAGLMHLSSIAQDFRIPALDGYLLCAQFNLHQISLHPLSKRPDQSDYQASSFPLVSSERIDFHPVDVLLDSDASILIVDTGGWYDLCCPSSGTDQRVATGGIYRLKGVTLDSRSPHDQHRLQSHRFSGATQTQQIFAKAEQLLAFDGLGDSAWIKRQALTDLSDALACVPIEQRESFSKTFDQLVLSAIGDPDPSVATLACHLASLYRMQGAREKASALLSSPNATLRRSAAEILGRIGVGAELPLLLSQVDRAGADRVLGHSLIYAMVEGATDQSLLEWLAKAIAAKRIVPSTVALVRVLGDRGKLTLDHSELILQMALADDPDTSELGLSILGSHPQWSKPILDALGDRLHKSNLPPSEPLLGLLAQWSDNPAVADWVLDRILQNGSKSWPKTTAPMLVSFLRGKNVPNSWIPSIADSIESSSDQEATAWQSALQNRVWKADTKSIQKAVHSVLQKIAINDSSSIEDIKRVLGWIAVLPKGSWVDESIEQLVVRESLQPVGQSDGMSQSVRTLAWQSLSQIQLRFDSSRQWILEHLGNASPLELPAAIDAYCKGSTSPQDERLLETLATVAASKTLAVETVLVKLKDRPAEVQKKWKESLEVWTKPDQDVQDKVQLWLGKLLVGDPMQGYHVFRSSKATCSACHQVGYVGGNVGPILSKIGQSRSRRDLLEAILFPSARLEQAYRSTKVLLQDGEVLQGLVVSETPKELVLQVSVDQRRSIETSEIQLREPSNVSIMPAGLEAQLSLQELSDLIAFLENAK